MQSTNTTKAYKRNSLDPSKHKPISSILHKNHTELQVKQSIPDSQISISNYENYRHQDLEIIFQAISQGKDRINVEDLYGILREEGYNDCLYSAVDMVALVDEGRKGFLTKKEFMRFFSNKTYIDEEQIPPLSREMVDNKKWVKAIDQNWAEMKDFGDPEYCRWVAEKLKQRHRV